MTVNVPLLRKVMEHIESHPEEWDQAMWVSGVHIINYPACGEVDYVPLDALPQSYAEPPAYCGTAFCFAGHVAHMTGWTPVWLGTKFDNNRMQKDGERRHVEFLAQEELGITQSQAASLFAANNELHDLRELVNDLIGE